MPRRKQPPRLYLRQARKNKQGKLRAQSWLRRKDTAIIVQGFFGPYAKRILENANKHRIAYISTDRSAVAEGALASISANFPALYERAATYVDKILKGENPASLPVEQPFKFQVTVNNRRRRHWG